MGRSRKCTAASIASYSPVANAARNTVASSTSLRIKSKGAASHERGVKRKGGGLEDKSRG